LFVFLISFQCAAVCHALRPIGYQSSRGDPHAAVRGQHFQHYILWVLAGIAGMVLRFVPLLARPRPERCGLTACASACRCSAISGASTRSRSFVRTLSSLLTADWPPVPSLETAARSISSNTIAQAVMASVGTVREGKEPGQSLEKTGVFPDLAVEMIDVGESDGVPLPADAQFGCRIF